MNDTRAERQLLFGLLALQMDCIDREQLIAALTHWVKNRDTPLEQVLVDQGALEPDDRDLLAPMVARHLRKHGDDPTKGLEALSSATEIRDVIAAIPDANLQATLDHLGTRTAEAMSEEATTAHVSRSLAQPPATPPTGADARFRVLRPHARGGLGQVYVARDEELGRHVALKEIRREHSDNAHSRSRFVLEAEINGNLEHPGIVPVYGLGTYDDGRPFYAMRFIQGDSLKEAIAAFHQEAAALDATSYNLRLRQLLGRFVDVCNAIAYAHSRGILHRDLKPANVMLGHYGETLVVDWGLAKATGTPEMQADAGGLGSECALIPASGSGAEPTVAGSALGTPGYMSPEQAEGRLDQLGPATDVYGLGATLYTLLTGRAPIQGDNARGILAKARQGEITPPRSIAPRVPPALAAICMKALALKPEDRYASARALADDVERFLADEAVTARRDPPAARAWRWIRKHRTIAASAAAVLLVGTMALGLILSVVTAKNAELLEANTRTRAAQELAEERLDLAMGAIEDYFTGVSEEALAGGAISDDLRDRLLEKPRQFYEQLTEELATKTDSDERERFLLAEGRAGLGRVLFVLGRDDEAMSQLKMAIADYEQLVRQYPRTWNYHDRLADALNSLGIALYESGQSDSAAQFFGRSLAIFEDLIHQRPDELEYRDALADGLGNVGHTLIRQGQFIEAREILERAISHSEALLDLQPGEPEYRLGLARNLNSLGIATVEMGEMASAIQVFERSVADYEALVHLQPGEPKYRDGLADGLGNLGVALIRQGQFDSALEVLRDSITQLEALVELRPEVPEYRLGLARSRNSLGIALAESGRIGPAAKAFERSVSDYTSLVEQRPAALEYRDGLADGLSNLGFLMIEQGRIEAAIETLQQSISIYDSLLELQPDNPELLAMKGAAVGNVGIALTEGGKADEAATRQREAIALQQRVLDRVPQYAPSRQFLSNHYGDLADALLRLGQAGDAAKATRESLALGPNVGDELYDGACRLALCLSMLVEANAPKDTRDALAAEAVAILRRAVEAGWSDADWTAHDPDLAPLRDRDDFQEILGALYDRRFPADPFAH